jgi:hypothetical protein
VRAESGRAEILARNLIEATAAALIPLVQPVAKDPRKLKPGELCRLLNSTPLGPVIDDRRLRIHRTRAGNRLGDGKTIDLLRYAGWLAVERHFAPPPAVISPETTVSFVDAYARKKEAERERNAEKSRKGRDVGEIPPPLNPQRRAEAEKSLEAWAKTYLNGPEDFYLEWSEDLKEAAADLDKTLADPGLFLARAMPRGGGKSTLGRAAVLKGALTGAIGFGVLIGATKKLGVKLLDKIKRVLLTNQLLLEDYPEVIIPIRKIGNVANRCAGQTFNDEPTFIEWGREQIVLPTIPGSKASGCILYSTGLDGAIRGLNINGRRPDFAFVDDPQTKRSAKSDTQTDDRMEILKNDVRGLGPPHRPISIYCAITVIYPGDLADRLLNSEISPDWDGKRYQLLYHFPTNMELWKEYGRRRRKSLQARGRGEDATEFYRKHRKKMDVGAVVAWEQRQYPDTLSALQHAMNAYFDDAAYFWAELQNQPKVSEGVELIDLDRELLRKRVSGHPEGIIPLSATHLVAHIDVQWRLLYWGALGCDNEIGGTFMYGTFPEQRIKPFRYRNADPTLEDEFPNAQPAAAVEAGLIRLLRDLRKRAWLREGGGRQVLELVLIDWSDGHMTDTVAKVCRLPEFEGWAIPAAGVGIGPSDLPMDLYKPREGETPGHHWILKRDEKRFVTHAKVDANYWKTKAAEALQAPRGNSGAIFFDGLEGTDHPMMGDHCTAEVGHPQKDERSSRKVTVFKDKPGYDNHHWDNLANCLAAASMRGCTVNGVKFKSTKRTKKRRRAHVSKLT